MSIRIKESKCIACERCLSVCPGSLLYQNQEGKAYIKYPKDCWGCTACLKECPVGAIEYYLGGDIGGKGGYLYTKANGEHLDWHIIDPNEKETLIRIQRKESNRY